MSEQTKWLLQLDDLTRKAVTDRFEDVSLAAGEVLFNQDDPGDSMYLITAGQLDVVLRDSEGNDWVVNRLFSGGVVGEMALLTGRDRVATVTASEATTLKRLAKTDFDALVPDNPTLLPTFSSLLETRLQNSQLVGVLSGLFGVLSYETIQEFQRRLIWKHIPAGTKIDYRDEPPGSMYIVVNGRLRASTVLPGTVLPNTLTPDTVIPESQEPDREIGRGDTYGDFNLLSGENNRIILTALRDTDIVRASQDVIQWLLSENPQSVLKFIQRTSLRLQTPEVKQRRALITSMAVALVPLGQGQPITELAERLSQQLKPYGHSLHLNSQQFDRRFGREGASQTSLGDSNNMAINHWLTEQERAHTFVLYECDAAWTAWTRRCLRQADRILLVSEAGRNPEPGELESQINRQGYPAKQELALIHSDQAITPTGTRAWLEKRNVQNFYHLRLSNKDEVGRLARRLIGKEVALVLSGGGSRGFAHTGVFKALQEAGIPVDMIGGASMGALIGGAICQGSGYEEILGFADRYGSPRTLYDFTIPVISFLASKKLTRMLEGVFAEQRIEDMWRPFFCVSADLTRAKAIIHQEGLAWRAVRGSVALPGIFAPYIFQGNVVVDGGVMNNFPIDLMRKSSPSGWVIGVNVSPPREMERDFRFDSGISGLQAILDRLSPFGRHIKAPSIFSTLTRSVEVRGIYQMGLVQDKADWIIQPDVARFNYLDFRPARDIAEAGYRATVEIIEELVAKFKAAGYQLG